MAFTPFSYDMEIIAKLSDTPNVDDGLTAYQLKEKFDEGGRAVKDYINYTLLEEAAEAITDAKTAAANAQTAADNAQAAADAPVTRAKLATDVLYSPIESAASKPITADDIGKTIRTGWNAATTYTLAQENSAQIPVGAEIAVLSWCTDDSEVLIEASGGVKLLVSGEVTIKSNGSVKISLPFGMIALKKITSNSNGDEWFITGNAEVVS